jgi:mono/diheme cytochrome c family protein
MTVFKILTVVATAALLVGCGGSSEGDAGGGSSASSTPQTTGDAASDAHPTKGIGPIDHVDLASLDRSLAATGAEVFEAKCTPCHKMEEKYVGPALKGVTDRRAPEWIMNMILNPDEMVKQDPAARKLLSEYIAPMTNQNLTEEEAKAVLVYFLDFDNKVSE